jgi:pimeloyl-ACP methyl ester carboxylesterase
MQTKHLLIPAGGVELEGDLNLPENAAGLVIFAHGSGSSRFSTRNQFVADILNQANLATLLFDLLTSAEETIDATTAQYRFDIPRLSKRLIDVIDWVSGQPETRTLRVGLFGASTGAAAALIAAAERPRGVSAVVSRGGRPDLAEGYLAQVTAPTLLLVGGLDTTVIELNERAAAQMQCAFELDIIPGATHLFEEAGKLQVVAESARDWFVDKLR